MNLRSLRILPLAALAAAAIPALAQAPAPRPGDRPPPPAPAAAEAPAATAAPAAAAAAGLPPIQPHRCVAPEYPGRDVSNTKIVAFNKDYKTYGDCIKSYVETNRAWANAVVEANNKAIDEYNKYTEKLRDAIEAAKQ